MKIPASELRSHDTHGEGDMLPGLDHGYVVEIEEGNGYLSYPSTGYGMSSAMPEDTLLITFHDSEGNECYLLCPPDLMVEVSRNA